MSINIFKGSIDRVIASIWIFNHLDRNLINSRLLNFFPNNTWSSAEGYSNDNLWLTFEDIIVIYNFCGADLFYGKISREKMVGFQYTSGKKNKKLIAEAYEPLHISSPDSDFSTSLIGTNWLLINKPTLNKLFSCYDPIKGLKISFRENGKLEAFDEFGEMSDTWNFWIENSLQGNLIDAYIDSSTYAFEVQSKFLVGKLVDNGINKSMYSLGISLGENVVSRQKKNKVTLPEIIYITSATKKELEEQITKNLGKTKYPAYKIRPELVYHLNIESVFALNDFTVENEVVHYNTGAISTEFNKLLTLCKAYEGESHSPCRRCSGSGYLREFDHVDRGICYSCNGTGKNDQN